MRLIDADAFAEFLKDAVKQQKYEDTKIDGLLTVADVIEAVISELDGTSFDGFKNAPTIQPDTDTISRQQKEGCWMREGISKDALLSKITTGAVDSFDNDGMDICSECGAAYRDAVIRFKFCPNCGAKMS